LIFGHGFEFQAPFLRIAAEYPKSFFIVNKGSREDVAVVTESMPPGTSSAPATLPPEERRPDAKTSGAVRFDVVPRDAAVTVNGASVGPASRFAGEDLKRGATVFRAGQPLHPAELGMLASLGIGEIGVYRKLRVAFFSTGDELRSVNLREMPL